MQVYSLYSSPSPSVELLVAPSMTLVLLFMGLVLWLLQDLCHSSRGTKAVCTAIPLVTEHMMVPTFSAMENQSRKFAVEIMQKNQEY